MRPLWASHAVAIKTFDGKNRAPGFPGIVIISFSLAPVCGRVRRAFAFGGLILSMPAAPAPNP